MEFGGRRIDIKCTVIAYAAHAGSPFFIRTVVGKRPSCRICTKLLGVRELSKENVKVSVS